MSEEKVLTLRGKKAVWAPGGGSGPIDPKRLPEGYPYKEVTVVNEPMSITWDGDTEGKLCVKDILYKVSDRTLTNEQIKTATIIMTAADGSAQEMSVADMWDTVVGFGCITDEVCLYWYDFAFFAVVREAGASVMIAGTSGNTYTFPEVGVYFMSHTEVGYMSALTTTEPVEQRTETIHPMAPEFLPLLTSPNGTKYKLSVADDGTLSAVAIE